MAEFTREGHRQHMRDQYRATGADGMDDHKLLELYLALLIPRKDVRNLSYDLIQTFGSLDGVFNASVDQLMSVNGIGESTAVAIAVSKDLANRINSNKSNSISSLDNASSAISYAVNILSGCREEMLLVVALDNKCAVKSKKLFDGSGINFIDANIKGITEFLLMTNASNVIIAHNHPDGYVTPSASDCNFTINFRDMMRTFGIRLIDHIIVSDTEGLSMKNNKEYGKYF